MLCRLENRRDEIRRRGLAVRAGDPDHLHLATGIAVERGGDHGERESGVFDHRPRHTDAFRRGLLGDDRGGAALDGLTGERRAVGVLAAKRHEHLSGRHRARVVRHAGHRTHGRVGARPIVSADETAAAEDAVQL